MTTTTTTTTPRTAASTVHVFHVGDRVRIRTMPTTPDQDAGHVGVVVHITARRILPLTVRVGHHRDQYDPTELEPADVEPDTPNAFPAAVPAPAVGKATNHRQGARTDVAGSSPRTSDDGPATGSSQ